MPWLILISSAVMEAVWATALGASNGLSVLAPSIIFFVALALSMAGLAQAMRAIPVGTAYAVWTGVGAVLTVTYSMAFGGEDARILKVLFLAGIIACVIGLKFVDSRENRSGDSHGSLPKS